MQVLPGNQICAGVELYSIGWCHLKLSGELVRRSFGTYHVGSEQKSKRVQGEI
jgi:hypothetical protein